MKGFTKLGRTLLALAVLAIMPLSASAQNFIMQTGAATYNATCGGVIKMKSTNGQFVNTGGLNELGETQTDAIKGIVDWAATSATQTVQGLYYEKMVISGGSTANGAIKTIADGVYIVGDVCDIADLLPGYANFATYPFYISTGQLDLVNTFQGTFNYIGTTQSVFPVTGDDRYNNLAMSGPGTYTMPDNTITTVNGTITLPTGNTLAVLGDLFTGATSTLAGVVGVNNGGSINIGTGDITFNGNVTVTDGSMNGGTGDIIIGSTSTLALVGNSSVVDLGANEEMFVTGTFTNGGDGNNLDFACNSVVTYNGTAANQIVVPTINSNPYGILNLSGGTKRGGLVTSYPALDQNNIAICGNFSLAGGNLDMITNGSLINNTGYVNMLNETSLATYTALAEVEGAFRRQFTTAAAGPYTFNNSGTQLRFTGAPDAAGFYQLFVNGDTNPLTYVPGTDVKRKITPSYSSSLGAIEYTLQAAYLAAELPGTFTSPLSEADLKFFEATDNPALASEKVAGTGYGRFTTSDFHTLSLSGIINGTAPVGDNVIERQFASGNDLVLRANNTMYSIVDGRWSNPNVWDEGRTPLATDNVELRTMVYVGINGPFAGTPGLSGDQTNDIDSVNNMRPESSLYLGGVAAANEIRIADISGSALIMGNEDNGGSYIHKTNNNVIGTASFYNNNTTLSALAFPIEAKSNFTSPTHGFQGLWLTSYTAGNNSGIPVLGTLLLQNSGTINNEGIIEVGN